MTSCVHPGHPGPQAHTVSQHGHRHTHEKYCNKLSPLFQDNKHMVYFSTQLLHEKKIFLLRKCCNMFLCNAKGHRLDTGGWILKVESTTSIAFSYHADGVLLRYVFRGYVHSHLLQSMKSQETNSLILNGIQKGYNYCSPRVFDAFECLSLLTVDLWLSYNTFRHG